MENKNVQSIWMAVIAFVSSLIQGCASSIVPILIAMIIFAVTTTVDFFTGVKASKKEGVGFDSGRARKCFNKWLIYLAVFMGTAFLGVLLTIFARMISVDEMLSAKGFFLQMLKWEIIIAAAIEVLSIFENMHRWLPDNIYITIIYYTLSIKIKDKLPELKVYFDHKKTMSMDEAKKTIDKGLDGTDQAHGDASANVADNNPQS